MSKIKTYKGVIDHRGKEAYILCDRIHKIVKIKKSNFNFMHDDEVEFEILSRKRQGHLLAKIISLVKRNKTQFVGIIQKTKNFAFVIIEDKKIKTDFFIPSDNIGEANNGDKVLEIGCGWGGFAEYLGKKYDVKLDCITISKKQFEYAKERIFNCGLNEKVNIEIKDYRDLKNKYNSIASIEMIEAVGQNYLESYFKTIKKNLSTDGRAAIQAITIDDSLFDRYKTKQDFIQKYIFPGGFLPSKNSLNKYVSDNGLTIKSYDSYADHYANTLAIWKNEFNRKWDLIKKQGFDLTFKRMWEFYLSYCEAGFKSKNIDLIQFSIQNK